MSESPYLYDVTLAISMRRYWNASLDVPVLVDSGQLVRALRALTPVLEKLAESYQGKY